MKFVDEAIIHVQAGKGGDGSASFRREKYVPKGGPDGGDGGRGGDVILVGDGRLSTLVDFNYQKFFKAQNGEAGGKRQCYGKKGDTLIIPVPLGTKVVNVETQEVIGEVLVDQQQLTVAKGGHGGLGNIHFKSSINRAPRKFTKGKLGESREIAMELQVLADVGLLGMPNAGKSTFISQVSAARPKVADYPFTTLYPQLGMVILSGGRRFVMADIPGLVEGASEGVGLGYQFLRHLQRTRVLLHLVDACDPSALENYHKLCAECEKYDATLAAKPQWVILNKIDLLGEVEQLEVFERFKETVGDARIYAISAREGVNTQALSEDIAQWVCGDDIPTTDLSG